MTLDTGLIDSNTHLGINAPPEERIKYQRILTCAPIKTENYSSFWTAERPSGVLVGKVPPTGIFYKTYNLGPNAGSNYTLAVSNKTTDTPYYLEAIGSPAFNRDSREGLEWKPIPPLDVKNADVTLIILRNEAMYQTPVYDPWFRATAVEYKNGLNPEGYYTADQMPASFVACTERHRVCSSETSCTPFGGVSRNATAPASVGVDYFGAYDARATGVRLNEQQKAAHDLLQKDSFGAIEVFVKRSTRALRALDFVVMMFGQLGVDEQRVVWSNAPPTNQWQVEIASMFNITVANMQVLAARLASPPDIAVPGAANGSTATFRLGDFLRRPAEGAGNATVCSRVRTRNLRHINFAFTPFMAVVAAGFATMFINLFCIPGVVFWLQRKLGRGQHHRREWQEGHLFIMQKTLFEAQGVGPWEVDEGGEIPWMPVVSCENIPLAEGETACRVGPQPVLASDREDEQGGGLLGR